MSDDIEMNFDDDMMDGFDDFDSFDNPEDNEGARNPIMNVSAGALERLKDTDNAVKLSRTIAENALPPGFKVAMDRSDDLVSNVTDIYNEAAKELKGPIKDLKKIVNGSIESASWLPEGIRRKIADATKVEEETYSAKVDPRELEIQEAQSRIFATMAKQNEDLAGKTAAADVVKTKIQVSGNDSIVAELRKISGYNTAIMSEYQSKNLELQFRQYYALKDLVEQGRATATDVISYLGAIKQNTGLPDIQKTRLSEEYEQAITDNLTGRFGETFQEYTAGFGKKLKENVSGKVKGYISDFSDMIGMAGDIRDVADSVDGMSAAEKEGLVGEELAGMALPFLGEKLSKRLSKLLAKNPGLVEKSNNLIYLSENYPGLLKKWLGSKAEDSDIAKGILEMIPEFGGSDINISNGLVDNGHEATTFSRNTDNSINVVIPGYLARILQATQQTAQGVNPDNPPELMSYSIESRDFESSSDSKKRTISQLTEKGNEKQSALDSIFEMIDPKAEMSKGRRERLATFFLERAADGDLFNVSDLANNYHDDEIAEIFQSINQRSSDEVSEINKRVARDQERLANGYKENSMQVNRMFNTGQRDTLRDLGLLEVDSTGKYSFDNDRLKQIIVSQLDTGKRYKNDDGSTLTGARVYSDTELKEQEEKRLLKERKDRKKGKKAEAGDDDESFLGNVYHTAKDTISRTATSAYDNMSPEFKADVDRVRAEAKRKLDEAESVVRELAEEQRAKLEGTETYQKASAFAADTKQSFDNSVLGESVKKANAFVKDGYSTVKDGYNAVKDTEISEDAIIDLLTRKVNDLKDVDLSYGANKSRVKDLTSYIGSLSMEELTALLPELPDDIVKKTGLRNIDLPNFKVDDVVSSVKSSFSPKASTSYYDFANDSVDNVTQAVSKAFNLDKVTLPTREDIESSYNKAKDFVQSPTLTMDLKNSIDTLTDSIKSTVSDPKDILSRAQDSEAYLAAKKKLEEVKNQATDSDVYKTVKSEFERLEKTAKDSEEFNKAKDAFNRVKKDVEESDVYKEAKDAFNRVKDQAIESDVYKEAKAKFESLDVGKSIEDGKSLVTNNPFVKDAVSTATNAYDDVKGKIQETNIYRKYKYRHSPVSGIEGNDYLDPSNLEHDEFSLSRPKSKVREMYDNVRAEVSDTLSEAIERGISGADYGVLSERLESYVEDVKTSFNLNLEGLKDSEFINNFKVNANNAVVSKIEPVNDEPVKQTERADIINRLEDDVERVNNSSLSTNEILDLANAVKSVGKDVLEQFKLAFRLDADDSLTGIPVYMSNVGTGGSESHLTQLVAINTKGFTDVHSALEEMHRTIAAVGLGDGDVEPGTKDVLLNSIGNLFTKAGGATKNVLSGYFSGASKLTTSILGGFGSVGGKIAQGLGTGIGTGASLLRSGQSDIFVTGRTKPVMLARDLIAGMYTDVKTGNTVRNVEDVTGEVVDQDGNVVVTEEEFSKGLFALDNGGLGSALKMVTTPFRLAFSAQANLIGALLSVPKKILNTVSKQFSKPFDVYVGGESEPRLHAFIFKNGGYRSNNTGKLIEHPDDIDGEVADLNGNVILTNEDLSKGLFTRWGRKVGSSRLMHAVKNVVGTALSTTYGAIKGSVNLGMSVAKTGLKGLGAAGNLGLRALGLKRTGENAYIGENDTLNLIYEHMQQRWPLTFDEADPVDDSIEDTLIEAHENLAETIKEAVTGEPPEKPAEDDSGSLFKFSASSDTDGDGDRDGGWRDILSRRKKVDKDGNPITERKDKEEGDGILGILGSIFGVLAPVGGLLAKGFAGLMGLFGLKKAGDFMTGGDIPDIDGPDGNDDKKKTKGKKPGGKTKGGKIGRWASKLWEGTKTAGSKVATGAKAVVNPKTVGLGLKTGAKWLGKKALVGLAGAGAIAAGILSAPLVVAAGIAYTAYEAYNLIDYIGKRSDMEDLEKLRFMQYGLTGDDYDFVEAIRELEETVEDEVVRSNTPSIDIPVSEIIDDHAEYFGFDLEDKQAVADFGYWYTRRFSPIFLTHSMAAYKVDKGIDITDVDDEMDGKSNKVSFIKDVTVKAKFLDKINVYQITNRPGPDFTVGSNRKQVMDYARSLIDNMGTDADLKEFKSPPAAVIKSKNLRSEDVPSPVEKLKQDSPVEVKTVKSRQRLMIDAKVAKIRERRELALMGTGRTESVPLKEGANLTSADEGTITRMGSSEYNGNYVTVNTNDGKRVTYHHIGDLSSDLSEGDIVDTETVLGTGSNKGYYRKATFIKEDKREKSPVVKFEPVDDTRYTAISSQSKRVVKDTPLVSPNIELAVKQQSVSEAASKRISEAFSSKLREANSGVYKKQEDIALANEQRSAMINNQGLMIRELQNIVHVLGGELKVGVSNMPASTPNKPGPRLNKVKPTVSFTKPPQY